MWFWFSKRINEETYLFQKLIRTAFQTNNVDHCTRLCHASSVAAALMECIGSGAVSAPFTAVKDADCMMIGARPPQITLSPQLILKGQQKMVKNL